MDALNRQLAMLRQIPRYPRKIDTVALRERLKGMGYEATLRTIQRDLNHLSLQFPLLADESKPQGWCWKKDAGVIDIPGLDPQTAMVFRMVEEHLKSLLPDSTVDLLKPWFESAAGVLNGSGLPVSKWPAKVRVLPKGMPLLPPKIDAEIQRLVYQALLEEKWIRIDYRARGGNDVRRHEVKPLGIVQRGPTLYLVGTIGDHQKPVMLLLHRMVDAELLDRPASAIDGFDLDQFIADGELNYRLGPPIQLTAHFSESAAAVITETLLSDDQVLVPLDAGRVQVTATVPDTKELRAWLRGFGAEITVVHPPNLV